MKLQIGHRDSVYGTIEDTPTGLAYDGTGGDEQKLRALVASVAGSEGPEGHPQGLPGFMRWFPRHTNNGYIWCAIVKPDKADAEE